jgi:hypothetical protein
MTTVRTFTRGGREREALAGATCVAAHRSGAAETLVAEVVLYVMAYPPSETQTLAAVHMSLKETAALIEALERRLEWHETQEREAAAEERRLRG